MKIMKVYLSLIITVVCISIAAAQPVQIKKGDNGKFGFVDEDDNWVVQPQFEQLSEFSDTPHTFAKLQGKWGLIDLNGKTILPFDFSRTVFNYWGNDPLVSVQKNRHYGLVNMMTGKLIADCVYDKEILFDETYTLDTSPLAIVYKNGKAGLLKVTGEEFVPCQYDKAKRPFSFMYSEMHWIVRQNNKIGVIECATGKEVLPCIFDEVKFSEDSMGNIFQVKRKGKYGLYSESGEERITPLYDKPFYFEGDYALAKRNGKYGAINAKGEAVVPFIYKKEVEALNKMTALYEN
jgi:hypothetical protein